jgi:hypothetical protein
MLTINLQIIIGSRRQGTSSTFWQPESTEIVLNYLNENGRGASFQWMIPVIRNLLPFYFKRIQINDPIKHSLCVYGLAQWARRSQLRCTVFQLLLRSCQNMVLKFHCIEQVSKETFPFSVLATQRRKKEDHELKASPDKSSHETLCQKQT